MSGGVLEGVASRSSSSYSASGPSLGVFYSMRSTTTVTRTAMEVEMMADPRSKATSATTSATQQSIEAGESYNVQLAVAPPPLAARPSLLAAAVADVPLPPAERMTGIVNNFSEKTGIGLSVMLRHSPIARTSRGIKAHIAPKAQDTLHTGKDEELDEEPSVTVARGRSCDSFTHCAIHCRILRQVGSWPIINFARAQSWPSLAIAGVAAVVGR